MTRQSSLVFPIGIGLSWAFNVLRIALLLVIDIEGAPDLAVGGFHSRAGWLAFTLLAFGLILTARSVPLFRRQETITPRADQTPFLRDPVAAALVPFAVFMLSAHVVSTFSETPGILCPWRAWRWRRRCCCSGRYTERSTGAWTLSRRPLGGDGTAGRGPPPFGLLVAPRSSSSSSSSSSSGSGSRRVLWAPGSSCRSSRRCCSAAICSTASVCGA